VVSQQEKLFILKFMKIKDIKSLAGRLRYIRDEMGLSQAELAALAKTTQQAIQQAESGKARNPRYLPLLAREIGVPFEWLSLNVIEGSAPKHLSEKDTEFLQTFKAMPKKEQDFMLDLMKSRSKDRK
jgi:transcriptional regulator with XRE-family HTH domain